jgi:hypothetical protein
MIQDVTLLGSTTSVALAMHKDFGNTVRIECHTDSVHSIYLALEAFMRTLETKFPENQSRGDTGFTLDNRAQWDLVLYEKISYDHLQNILIALMMMENTNRIVLRTTRLTGLTIFTQGWQFPFTNQHNRATVDQILQYDVAAMTARLEKLGIRRYHRGETAFRLDPEGAAGCVFFVQ